MQLGCSSEKTLSQKSLATYSLSYQELIYESKGTQIASMKCGSLKSGIGDSKLLTRVFIHVVVALTKSIATRPPSLFREHNHGHLGPGFH